MNLEPEDYYSRLNRGKYETPAMLTGIGIAVLVVYTVLKHHNVISYFF